MANQKKGSNEVKEQEWFEASENAVVLHGVIKRVLCDEKKVQKFTLETVQKTPKGNWSHQFVPVVVFDKDMFEYIVEGNEVVVTGYITTNSYENKKKEKVYEVTVIANEVNG